MGWNRGELLRITGLYLLIVPFLNVLNATAYENAQIQGYFGVSSTQFMYMNLIPVFTLIAGIPLALEIAKQIKLRTLLYTVIIFSLVLNSASAFAPNFYLYILFRSLLAFLSIMGIFGTLFPIIMRYNPAFNMAILYGIVQFIIQGSSLLYKYFGAQVAHIYDWRTSIMMVNLNFLLCFVLTLVFVKKDVAPLKTPFLFDFRGWLILILFFTPILFLTAEGQIREWYSDRGIKMATALILIVIGIYAIHLKFSQNPLIDFKVFKYKNVVIGSVFFFLIGVLNNTGSVILGFMSGILGFDDLYQARTHLTVFVGILISIPLCTWLLYKRVYLRIISVSGFLAFGIYHLLMFYRFYPGIGAKDFVLPLIFKGIGIGFLYVISSLYISENVPKPMSTSRMMSGLIARNVIAILLGSAILGTVITRLTLNHTTGISQQLNEGNLQAVSKYNQVKNLALLSGEQWTEAEKAADNSLRSEANKTAKMLAYKDIYLAMAIISLIPILLILIMGMGKRAVGTIEVEPIPI